MRRTLIALAALALIAADEAPHPFADLDVRAVNETSAPAFDVLMQLGEAKAATTPMARAKLYRRVLAHDPALQPARLGLGEALLDMGDIDAARDALLGAGTGDLANTLRLIVQVERGERDDADVVLSNRFVHFPDARLMNALGRWEDARGRHAKARVAFRRAAALQRPGLAEANIATSYGREGLDDEALSAWQRAVQADPLDPNFRRGLRLSHLARGDYHRALDGISGAQSVELLSRAGMRAAQSGEPRLARLLLRRAAELNPRHDPAILALLQQLDDQMRDKAEHAQ